MKYNAPYGSSDTNAAYVDGNPINATPGSVIPAEGVEYPQREIINAIIAAGLVGTNSDLTQLTQAIKLLGRIPYVVDGGAANAIVVNPAPAITSLVSGQLLAINVNNTNTGAATINASGLGAVPFTRNNGVALSGGDVVTGGIIIVGYDGAKWQLLSVPAGLNFPAPQQLWHYGVDTSNTANAIIATVDNIGTSWPTGLPVAIKVKNANTLGTVTVALNGLATVNLTRGSGTPLTNGDILAGFIALMIYDGTEAQIINPQAISASSITQIEDITGPDRPYWITVNSIGVTSPPGSPAVGDTYLIPIGATGIWSGLSGNLSQWNGTAWVHRQWPVGSYISASDTLRAYQNVTGSIWAEVFIRSIGTHYFFNQI